MENKDLAYYKNIWPRTTIVVFFFLSRWTLEGPIGLCGAVLKALNSDLLLLTPQRDECCIPCKWQKKMWGWCRAVAGLLSIYTFSLGNNELAAGKKSSPIQDHLGTWICCVFCTSYTCVCVCVNVSVCENINTKIVLPLSLVSLSVCWVSCRLCHWLSCVRG